MSESDGKYQKTQFLYQTVRDDIIEMIVSRALKAHDAIPSEGNIADTYHVSRMTGKLALKSLEDAGVIYRLNRRGSFLAEGFEARIEVIKRDPKSAFGGTQLTVALVVPGLDFYVGDIVNAINEEATARSIRVLLRITDDDSEKEDRIVSELAQLTWIQGIILFPAERSNLGGELLKLRLQKYPIVLIDRNYGNRTFDTVVHTHYKGAHEATSHLVENGHLNIGFVSAALDTSMSREQRYQGYLHALIEHAAPVKKEHIQIVHQDIHAVHGVHVMDSPAMKKLREFLAANDLITAVFCSEDYLAIELYYAATSLGKQVPEDLSIIGFTDNRALRFVPVRMSTVRQPVAEMGTGAIALLMNRLREPDRPYQEIDIETEIVERDSVCDLRKVSDRSRD